MGKKGPRTAWWPKGMDQQELARHRRVFERTLLYCADCGLIRGTHDQATLASFYSVMIEKPDLAKHLCSCPDAEEG